MKKTGFILLLMLLIVSVFAFVNYYSSAFTGTTTNAYVTADSIVTKNIDNISIAVYNSGSTNSINYKIVEYYGSWDGVSYEAVLDTLANVESNRYSTEKPMYGIKVLVKSAVAGSTSTYTGYLNFNK